MKINKKHIVTLISGLTSILMASIPVVVSNNVNINSIETSNNDNFSSSASDVSKNDNQSDVKPLVPLDFHSSIPLLVQETGPIISQKSIITSLDWFGAERWHIDLEKVNFNGQTFLPNGINRNNWNSYFDSAMINYALDKNNHRLWVLSNTGNGPGNVAKQRIMEVDTQNGQIIQIKDIQYQGNKERLYRKIQVLDSGNVIIYSHGENSFDLYDASSKTVKTINYNSSTLTKNMNQDITDMKNEATRTFSFLFSISPNVNIAVFTPEAWYSTNAQKSGKIYFAYVDDSLNIINSLSQEWSTAKDMKNTRDNMTTETFETINSSGTISNVSYVGYNGDSFPKLSYKLPDNRTLVTIYNKFYIFWPTSNNNEPTYKEFDLNVQDSSGKYRPIESWTTDTGNNVYVKFAGDTKIQKITINGSTFSDTTINLSTYYDISGSQISDISNNAKNLVLYNVYGYSGQIMLLNPVRININSVIDLSNDSNITKYEDKKYGLAAAVVDSKEEPGKGDSKGLLNTSNAFTKSSTFNISQDILQNKLPSELTRNDLDITENGFLTSNNTVDSTTGELKYKQFVKSEIDDNNRTIKITVNIDQIPWFVNNGVMPSNIPPLTVQKTFTTTNNIESRISWKDVNLDYDFKNTLPTKVTLDDIKRFDPFSINISSQQITISGETYPKKTYSIGQTDNETGKITLNVNFEYLPLDVDAKTSNILSQNFTKEYQIFKNSDKKYFNFVSSKGSNETEDITQIPQLKELSESNLLPSSFGTYDYNSILKFINTDTSSGYPISKMKFNVVFDDEAGTLKITGKLQDGYYEDVNSTTEFSKTYTGLNKISDYNFNLFDTPSSFNKSNYRPSEINEQILYNNFVKYNGFNSSDLSITLIPNDEIGQLRVIFKLDNSYPKSVAERSGFVLMENNYQKEYIISGFKTTKEYENQYVVFFKDDNSKDFENIKKYTPNQIKQILEKKSSNGELYIGNNLITTEQDFAKNVVEDVGSNLKNSFDSNTFEQNIYYNDTNGEITIKISFNNTIDSNNNQLVFIQRFTGFAKGNQVPTDDIFSFKTQEKLMFDNPEFKEMLPSQLKKALQEEENKEEINKYISFSSINYSNSINDGKYQLEIINNDIFGYLTIKIIFESNNAFDSNSLLVYTVTYNGFATE